MDLFPADYQIVGYYLHLAKLPLKTFNIASDQSVRQSVSQTVRQSVSQFSPARPTLEFS